MNNNRRIKVIRIAIEPCNILPRGLLDISTSLKMFSNDTNYRKGGR